MQLSNRLTFSLASLILIFAFAFVAMPAMAASGGPTVTFAEYSGPADPTAAADPSSNAPYEKTRGDFRVKLTFSHAVVALTADNVQVREGNADGSFSTPANISTAPVEVLNSGGKEFVATVTTSSIANTVTRVFVSIADDAVLGNRDNLLGNVGNNMTFGLPPLNVGTVTLATPAAVAGTPGLYTIVATFNSMATPPATHSLSPGFAAQYVDITPENLATATIPGSVDTSTNNMAVVTINVQLVFGASDVKVKIDPGYVAGSNTITLPPPAPADPVYQNPPAVTLSVTNHDAAERTFQVSVSTTPADNTEGEKGTDITGIAIKDNLMVKDGSTPAADVGVNRLDDDPSNERISANSYRAILEYGPFDTLPLTVSIDPDALATPADPAATGVDPVTDMVGTAAPVGTDDDPSVAITVSNYNAATRQFRVQVTITPGMKADGSAGDPITAFGLSNLKITDAGDAAVMITTVDERFTAGTAASRAGMYVAILQYNPLAVLPLTITTVDGFMSSDDPKTTAMVPPGGTTTPPPANAPAKPAAPTATINTANDLIIDVSWTAPADNGSAITGYTVKKYGADGALVKTFPDDDPNTATITTTSYSIGPVPAADRGESFTLTVTAMNANGSGPESDMSAAVMIPAAPTSGGNTAPKFDDPAPPDLTWCEGETRAPIVLPKGSDKEGDVLKYSLSPELPENPDTVPAAGLYWVTVEGESRELRGKALLDDAGTYTWTVTDDGSPSMSKSMTFTIVVKPATDPAPPTQVKAMKVNSATKVVDDPERDRVKLTWADTNPTMYPNPGDDGCIPEVVAYIVTRTPFVNGEVDITNAVEERLTKAADASNTHYNLDDAMALTYMTKDKLDHGVYIFTIQAVSKHPISGDDMTSLSSRPAVWDKTDPGTRVIVTDPPAAPTDLRATVNEDNDKVTVNWIAPEETSLGPVDDTDPADRMRLYGVDQGFGGYVVYRIKDGETVRYPEDEGEVLKGDEVVFETEDLNAGQYSFRVTAVNIAGESQRSESTPFSTVTVIAVNDPPVFTKTSIPDINAMVGEALPRAISLPTASDPEGQTVHYSVTPSLPSGLMFNATASPAPTITGTPASGSAGTTVHTYTAYDAAPDATGVMSASLSFTVIVAPEPGTPPQPGAPSATYDEATSTTTIRTGTVDANGFYVVEATGLPDLELFFSRGGTITLTDPADAAAKSVVISEILWGLDYGEPALTQSKRQFIELYNTSLSGTTNLTGWKLVFKQGSTPSANDVDQISNVAGAGWTVDVGQSGRVTGTTLMGGTILPTDIISMYRNINYNKVQNADDAKRLEGVPGGNSKGSWKASTRVTVQAGVKSSPGRRHFQAFTPRTASSVAGTPFRINEIGNDTGSANDWIELHNVTDSEKSLKNYQLSKVTAQGTDTQLFHFHDQDWKVPAKGYVVISTRHPRDTDLAVGKDFSIAEDRDTNADNDQTNAGAKHFFVVKPVDLPDNGKFALILRNNHESKHLGTGNQLVDVVATRAGSFADANIGTSLWPLTATGLPHGNVIDGTGDEDFRSPRVYQRNSGNGRGEKQLSLRGYTGVGYDRIAAATGANGGTPGYDNGAVKEKIADLSNAKVTFSEIMLSVGDGRQNLPQWIELYNSSMTQSVNTNGWKLHIENYTDVTTSLDSVLTLDSMVIPPNQTILIVTNIGRTSDPDHFPSHRVVNLWSTKKHRDELEMERRTDQVFSAKGFYFKLTDKDNKTVDEVGNLDGSRRTRNELMSTWEVPMNGEDGRRSSLIRVYDAGVNGQMAEGWVLADETNLAFVISSTYYGDPADLGTPGFRAGGPLPVSLSKFRPERLESGEVVVRWVTESELNNAGFNILRSEAYDGEFKQVNTKLIAGKGTTSEKNSYDFVDTSAKPNVVYYYQIQDVSLDGDVQTLRTTRLKGHVSAAGKATTTWGELKALQ